jgi:ABC-2 type transport system ATP-binding protein
VSEARKEGDKIRLYTADPASLLEAVNAYAGAHQNRLMSVTTRGPTLEDVFIRLTGLSHWKKEGNSPD